MFRIEQISSYVKDGKLMTAVLVDLMIFLHISNNSHENEAEILIV